MYLKTITPVLLGIFVVGSSIAQTVEKVIAPPKEKREIVISRNKTGDQKKTTVTIDGDVVTINGKDLREYNIAELQELGDHHIMPHAPNIRMRTFPRVTVTNVKRAFLGVASEKTEQGARIITVSAGSAAEKAGLLKGDVITSVGSVKIEGSDDLFDAVGKYKPEEKVSISYLRDGKTNTTTATLGTQSADERKEWDNEDFKHDFNFEMPRLKELGDLNFSFNRRPRLGLQIQDQEEGNGVKILDVNEGSPASKAGLQKGDVVTSINGNPIKSVDELMTSMKDTKEGDSVKLTFQRNGNTQTVDLRFPKKLKTMDL